MKVTRRPFASPLSTRLVSVHPCVRSYSSSRANVYETLTLLRFPDTASDEVVEELVNSTWSLQYVVPGPICGSAGPLETVLGAEGSTPPFQHAVLFRYGQERSMQNFLNNQNTLSLLEEVAPKVAESLTTICFKSAVPNELEAIFRRGQEWDEGWELVMALVRQPGSNEADADEFLELTQQLAASPAFGAVQATAGPCIDVLQHADIVDSNEDSLKKPDIMFLARFQTAEQVVEFTKCPPVAAMIQGDERSPLRAIWAAALKIAPTENSNSITQI